MIDLKKVYDKINKDLNDLYCCSGYQELVRDLKEQIELMEAYFGMVTLKIDVGPFKKDETVYIDAGEWGADLRALGRDDRRVFDLFSTREEGAPEGTLDDWIYPIPEPPVEVTPILTGEKTVEAAAAETVKRINYLVSKEKFDF